MRTRRLRSQLEADLARPRWGAAVARRVLAAWRESGMSRSGFGRTHGVSPHRLSRWRKRLGGGGEDARSVAPLAFIPAEVTGGPTPSVVVRLPGGVVLEAAELAAMSPTWIAALVRELAAAT